MIKDVFSGAWGCGEFHNDPRDVASYFKKVLIDEGYGRLFNNVCFAIYGEENGNIIMSFRKCFGKI